MGMVNTKRWELVNRKTGQSVRFYDTRAQARRNKRSTQRIYDTATGEFVR